MTTINHTPAPWDFRVSANCPDVWEIVASFCESPIAEVPRWQDEDGGNGRVKLTHPGRLILTHLGLQNGRSGQERHTQVTRPFGPSLLSSTRGTGSSRHSSRKCGSGGSVGRAVPQSSVPPGRSGSTH
jgi:hypothetical protein